MKPIVCLAVAVAGLTASSALAQTAEQQLVLNRVTLWVSRFVENYSNVVAEEVFVQETVAPRRRRTLRSDFLFVRFPGTTVWYSFRDTLEVDGKPLPDAGRMERMLKLFQEPPESAARRADEIAAASTKYNLMDVGSLNDPLRVLAYMQEGYRDRFRFIFGGIERDLGPTVRTIRFEEFARPTILRRGSSRSLDYPSFGLIWVDEPTGRVVKTELRPGRFAPLSISITTTFRVDERLGIDVPAEMRDLYLDRTGEFRGTATYGNFRRFQASATEQIDVPPTPR